METAEAPLLLSGNNNIDEDDEQLLHSDFSLNQRGPASSTFAMIQNNTTGLTHGPAQGYLQESLEKFEKDLVMIRDEIEEDHALWTSVLLESSQLGHASQEHVQRIVDDVSPFHGMKCIRQETPSSSTLTVIHHAPEKTSSKKYLATKEIQSPGPSMSQYTYYIEIERSLLVEPELLPDAIPKSASEIETEKSHAKTTEKLSYLGPYLGAISAAYTEAFESHPTKELDIVVERIFNLPNGSYAEFRTPYASELSTPLITPSLGTYINEGCLICSVHHCHVHGIFEEESINEEQESGTSEQMDNSSRNSGGKITSIKYKQYNIPDMHIQTRNGAIHSPHRGNTNENNIDRSTYCSSACFKAGSKEGQKLDQIWSREENEILEIYLMQVQEDPNASCLLAPMLHRSCVEVHCNIERMNKLSIYGQEIPANAYEQPKTMRAKDREKYTSNEHIHHKRRQPIPCNHPGQSCSVAGAKKCSCIKDRVYCDKFCGCPKDCDMRYQGCSCTRKCLPDKCLCQKLNRECDPDLCHSCGAVDSARSSQSMSEISCYNCEIQRGIGKKVVVGESSREGLRYGLYLAEPARKGDFIAEYVGEIITTAEEKRRETATTSCSASTAYFFSLNDDVTIDAYRMGNATRFINHSIVFENCKAKVLLVNCEHRIGFFALKDIDAGTELFFSYGRQYDENLVDVTKNQGKGSKHSKAKVETHSTSLSQDDDIDDDDDDKRTESEEEESMADNDPFGTGFDEYLKRASEGRQASDDDEEYIEGKRRRRRREGAKRKHRAQPTYGYFL